MKRVFLVPMFWGLFGPCFFTVPTSGLRISPTELEGLRRGSPEGLRPIDSAKEEIVIDLGGMKK
jgi:hypothetical protein